MRTEICDQLEIEFPIFAFSHCRDVVAAVSNAGGIGVLGAVGFTADQLEVECQWIDEHVGDRPYGVDMVIPGHYEGMGELDPDKLEEQLRESVPQEHYDFVAKVMADHGVPEIPEDEDRGSGDLLGWTAATAAPLVDVAVSHDKVKLIANALGTPPPDVIDQVHDSGRLVAALSGAAKHARSHVDAGVDIVVAQGHEAGGHTGEVGSMVLWPEVIDAVGSTPVLAAGGIGSGRQMAAALAMGAQGVWTGSLWLTVEEADTSPTQMKSFLAAGSRDTVRSRSVTGKPARMLRNDWTEAWDDPDTPDPLPMPLQYFVSGDAVSRGHRYPEAARDVMFSPVGQIVGAMDKTRKVKDVIFDLVEECIEAQQRLTDLFEA